MATIAERIAAAKAQSAAATALVSADDLAEIKAREELASYEDATRVARRVARLLALDRAKDAMVERFSQNAIDVLDLEDATPGGGAYVLRNPPHADVTAWQAKSADATLDAGTRDTVLRNFAMSSVLVFVETMPDGTLRTRSLGGKELKEGDDPNAGRDLHILWTTRVSGAPTSIANKATDLAGFVAAKRKS